ncbi:septal ring lytic transglycosylase RlpA family protein [Salinimonas marina]|uniref:Endolytic peptidoglycan transglycosylase RlpA n=2 Tax=Salinimonas marina TaxID=2785918 RepID=A0A7S9E0L0_9ALTE|nr:septal ring lytic transglycosylase RlpA family protein [Salinimonas marina]
MTFITILRLPALLAMLVVGGCSTYNSASSASTASSSPSAVTVPANAEQGQASYYAHYFEGRTTASGERFDHCELTAAHRTYAFGTRVRVTHAHNGNSVVVRINDRGPFVSGRIIDLSSAAFSQLSPLGAGVIPVTLMPLDN